MLRISAPAPNTDPVTDSKILSEIRSNGVPSCVTPTSNSFVQRFTLGSLLGRGAFSDVRLCRCRSTGVDLACKIVNKDTLHDPRQPKQMRRLRDELRVLAAMRHPNIMPLLAVYETGTELLMIMELAKGGELFDRIVQHGHFSERDAATVASGMLAALVHLHAHGIMHRDVKPENLLLVAPDSWQVKLTDFGLVRVMNEMGPWNEASPTSAVDSPPVLAPHTLCGSTFYVAPEIVQQQPVCNTGVDVWSAGVVLYIMLCGAPPFQHTPAFAGWQVAFPEEEWATVSAAAKELIRAMLTWEPQARITADAALQHAWISPEYHASPMAAGAQLAPSWPTSMRRFNTKRKRAAAATPRQRWTGTPKTSGLFSPQQQSAWGDAAAAAGGVGPSGEGPFAASPSPRPARKLRHVDVVPPSPAGDGAALPLSSWGAAALGGAVGGPPEVSVLGGDLLPAADMAEGGSPHLEAMLAANVDAWSTTPQPWLSFEDDPTLVAGDVDEVIPMLESPSVGGGDTPLPMPSPQPLLKPCNATMYNMPPPSTGAQGGGLRCLPADSPAPQTTPLSTVVHQVSFSSSAAGDAPEYDTLDSEDSASEFDFTE